MRIMLILIVGFGMLLPLFSRGLAQENDERHVRQISAVRLTDASIEIDGRLNESIWNRIPQQGNFIQRDPDDGASSSQETEFAVCYDTEFLYVGIRAFDDEPALVTGILTRRDESSPSDWVYISVDSYYDHRTAFEFGLNAAGVKQDLRRFDDESLDFDWDAVWAGAVNQDAEGWSAEFAIPFRELRFNSAAEMTWGLNVYRELPRNNNELAVWNYWSHEETGFVSNYGELTDLQGIQPKMPVYVSPYVMTQTAVNDKHLNQADHFENGADFGADIRKSFALGLTFSGTINPDFGQVEADPAEFNLTEFESYFSERRPFFMEGGNILNFSLGFGDGDNSANSLFYSRRIGRVPQGGYVSNGTAAVSSVDSPEFTRILGAGKLTGKLNNGLSIGLMSAITAEERATVSYVDGTTSTNVVEPATTYLLGRVQQDYRGGFTTVGGILTATMRSLDGTDMEWLRESAYTGGMDFNHRFGDQKYDLNSAIAFSHVKGSQASILSTQLNPSRYFQRPDAPHLSVDSSATSLSGFGAKFIFGRNNGKTNFYTGLLATSPGLEINDLGFMRAVDNINQFIWFSYKNREPSKYLLNYRINFNEWANWTFGGESKGFGGNVNANATLTNNWFVGGGINLNRSGIVPFHLHGGPSIQGSDNLSTWASLGSDRRRELSLQANGHAFTSLDDVLSLSFSPSIQWRPKKNIALSLGPDFQFMDDTWAWITSMTDSSGGTHYVFSDLTLSQTNITFRANVTLSTTLSFQFFTQAFLMGADYENFKEVADNTARDINNRFTGYPEDQLRFDANGALGGVDLDNDGIIDYWPASYVYSDVNYRELTSNMVLRWEYSSGSVMYLVWSRGASAYDPFWEFDPGKDLKSLIDVADDNIFLLKINKLLNL